VTADTGLKGYWLKDWTLNKKINLRNLLAKAFGA